MRAVRRANLRTVARGARAGACALALLLGGCETAAPVPTPLTGPMPRAVLVLPPRDATGVPGRRLLELAEPVDAAMRQRGYRALPIGVGYDLLRQSGWTDGGAAAERETLRATADVDAVLELTIDAFEVHGERPLQSARYDLTWRLLTLADLSELWRHHERGTYSAALPERGDPTRAPDAEPATLPFGTLQPRDFRDVAELVAALHRAAMARLPRRGP